jgi:folate-binding protein YgfZ
VPEPAASGNVVILASLRFRGRDAASFLHGQLSSDVLGLAVGAQQLAGYHNPQGRVIALLRLARPDHDELLAQLPAELAEAVAQRLRRYVLRAKLTIELLQAQAAARSRLADIAAGLPQVYTATSEKFVAQMLNLDCLGAVAFDKGCYTGQEVIARAHFRGRVKRRMQRFGTRAPALPPALAAMRAGGSLRLGDGRRLELVDAAAHADGRVEFLAVAPLAVGGEEGMAEINALPSTAEAPPFIDCEALPLPYALPD